MAADTWSAAVWDKKSGGLEGAAVSRFARIADADKIQRDIGRGRGPGTKHSENGGGEEKSQLHERCFPRIRFHSPRFAPMRGRVNAVSSIFIGASIHSISWRVS